MLSRTQATKTRSIGVKKRGDPPAMESSITALYKLSMRFQATSSIMMKMAMLYKKGTLYCLLFNTSKKQDVNHAEFEQETSVFFWAPSARQTDEKQWLQPSHIIQEALQDSYDWHHHIFTQGSADTSPKAALDHHNRTGGARAAQKETGCFPEGAWAITDGA